MVPRFDRLMNPLTTIEAVVPLPVNARAARSLRRHSHRAKDHPNEQGAHTGRIASQRPHERASVSENVRCVESGHGGVFGGRVGH